MTTELWFPGVKLGWLSGLGLRELTVTAELDGIDTVYRGTDGEVLERAFSCTVLSTLCVVSYLELLRRLRTGTSTDRSV